MQPGPPLRIATALWVLLNAPAALASPADLARVVEGPIGRFLFSRTPQGMEALSKLGVSRSDDLAARLRAPELATEAAALERRLAGAERGLREFRTERSRSLDDRALLKADERLYLRQLAARDLRVDPDWRPPSADPRPGRIDFTGSTPVSRRQRFLVETSSEPAVEAAARPRLHESTGWSRARAFTGELKQCVRNMPPTESRSNEMRYLLTQLGISEAMTVGAYVAASGSGTVDWKNLPTDIFITTFSSVVGTRVLVGNYPFHVRWLRLFLFSEARSGVDAVVYYVTPWKDTHGIPAEVVELDRLEFNAVWILGSPLISVSLYTLLSGLECMYPGARMALASTGLRLATAAGTSYVYFRLRNRYTGRSENHATHSTELQIP